MPEPLTPAEVIAAATCSGPRFGGGPAPCEVCRGRAERDVAALAEGGYAIVPAADPGPGLPAVPDKFVVKVMTSLSPYSPEYLADLLDLDAADLRDRYGDTVLYGLGATGLPEFRRGGAEPSPAEVREAAAILRQATGSGTAPQPPGTTQGAFEGSPGISGRSDDPQGTASLSGAREEILRKHLDIVVRTRAAAHDGSKLTTEARDDFVDQLVELYDMSEKGELV